MQDHPSFVCMPALGDATNEATDNSEAMAAAQLARFLEEGDATRRQRGRCHLMTQGPHEATARQPSHPAARLPRMDLPASRLLYALERGANTAQVPPRGCVNTLVSARQHLERSHRQRAGTLLHICMHNAHAYVYVTQALSPTPSTSPTRRSLRSRASTRASASSTRTGLG